MANSRLSKFDFLPSLLLICALSLRHLQALAKQLRYRRLADPQRLTDTLVELSFG